MTIRHSVFIARPKETVWDFTQNYDLRHVWDRSVLKAKLVQTSPNRIIQLRLRGNVRMTFVYKLDERPDKTTLAATDVHSPLIRSAGGSWTYEAFENGTQWTQTNTIIFKNNLLVRLMLPFLRRIFMQQAKQAMNKAKKLMEINS